MTTRDDIFSARHAFTTQRLDEFVRICTEKLAESFERVIGNHACVYAVGSAGRLESSERSDLDVFLVETEIERPSEEHSLSTTLLSSAVIRSFRHMGLPDPSNGGEYLQLHTLKELRDQIGDRTDDPQNTFTARMLLLLESRPLIGSPVYERVLDGVLAAYWKDYEGREDVYVPILLINDIVRYWRVLLLNYVAMNLRRELRQQDAEAYKTERRLRSYKLRFARCLTCYSALAYLLTFKSPGIAPADIKVMARLCPYERLRAVGERATDLEARQIVSQLLDTYAAFLELMDTDKATQLSYFDRSQKDLRYQESNAFGEKMAGLMQRLGAESPKIFRYMLV
ncbi:MAG: DUF294 nucleotidyltransferase-like domain-containing protein [Polyangiaceae bacterium]